MASTSTEVTQAARAIAYAAEVEGVDPEQEALLFPDLSVAQARLAVREAQARYGLSTQAEWAEDFLAAHKYGRRHGFDALLVEVPGTPKIKPFYA